MARGEKSCAEHTGLTPDKLDGYLKMRVAEYSKGFNWLPKDSHLQWLKKDIVSIDGRKWADWRYVPMLKGTKDYSHSPVYTRFLTTSYKGQLLEITFTSNLNTEPELKQEIRSHHGVGAPRRMKFTLVIALLFALVATAGAAPMDYDYKPGEFLVIKSGESPDKTFCIVSGEDKAGEFGVYLMDAKTKAVLGRLEEIETSWGTAPEGYGAYLVARFEARRNYIQGRSALVGQRHLPNRK